MRLRKPNRKLILALAIALGVFAVCGTAYTAFRHTFGTEVKVTQIRASVEADDEDQPMMDKKIPRSMRRALKRRFRSKYERYTLLAKEVRECKLGEEETFTLRSGKDLTVRVVGYSPSKKIIDMKIQTSENIVPVSVKSGTHIVDNATAGDEPLIIVVTPRLLQIER